MNRPAAASPAAVTLPELVRLAGAAAACAPALPSRPGGQQGGTVGRMRGRGMEYAESRPYQPGDDPRSIDWRVTARSGRVYTKLFREEREHPILLSVDLRPAMFFATRGLFKSVLAARAAALMAWIAVQRGERVGLQMLTADGLRSFRPGRGRRAALAICQALSGVQAFAHPQPEGTGPRADGRVPALNEALTDLARLSRPGSRILVIGDFHDLDDQGVERLGALTRHAEVLALLIYDRLEAGLPPPGHYRVLTSGGERVLDTGAAQAVAAQQAAFAARRARLARLAALPTGQQLVCETHEDVVRGLQQAFAQRGAAPAPLPAGV